jgi:ribonuclease HI
MSLVRIHTDGACQPNPGKGGWAYIIDVGGRRFQDSGTKDPSTNNEMELYAIYRAILSLKIITGNGYHSGTLYTDSKYATNALNQWADKWSRNNWLKSDGSPVKNKGLIKTILLIMKGQKIRIKWIKGHADSKLNQIVDDLAQKEIINRNIKWKGKT